MDKLILQKIEEKIQEIIRNKNQLKQLSESFSNLDNSNSFMLGMVVGRLYNSFFYQTKRLKNREPTEIDFEEFLKLIETKKPDLENLW